MHPILRFTAHRPWPLASGPWIMHQTWNDLLFAHWPLAPEALRPLVPSVLQLDTFNGQCWIAVTPFHMTSVRARWTLPLPGISALPELNVRAYVRYGNKPGVFFFSLDAGSWLAVLGARSTYHLPYFHARFNIGLEDGWFKYNCVRLHGTEFHGKYRPIAPVQLRDPGTLEHWLTERYCLYTVVRNSVYRAEIHHQQWPLQDADAEIVINTMAAASRIDLPRIQPLLHFSRQLDVLIWPLKRA